MAKQLAVTAPKYFWSLGAVTTSSLAIEKSSKNLEISMAKLLVVTVPKFLIVGGRYNKQFGHRKIFKKSWNFDGKIDLLMT